MSKSWVIHVLKIQLKHMARKITFFMEYIDLEASLALVLWVPGNPSTSFGFSKFESIIFEISFRALKVCYIPSQDKILNNENLLKNICN